MKTPITDAVATIIIMLALIAGGYFFLVHQTDKVLQDKQNHSLTQPKEKSTFEKLAPKTFEALSKRTE